jgi:hypothetical protein
MTKLTDLLVNLPEPGIKMAAVEQPDREQLEQDFGRMAYMFLKDRAAQLLDYLIGFEIVEQEEDGSKAVGIFGFNINDSFYYVPAFFLNNQVKGMDLLYSKKDNTFVPLRDKWLDHIVDRQSIRLGRPADAKVRKDFSNPDFSFITYPPLGGAVKLSEVMHDLAGTWNVMQNQLVEMLEKDAEFGESLAGAVNVMQGKGVKRAQNPNSKLVEYLHSTGGPIQVRTLLNSLEDPEFLKSSTTFYSHKDLMVSEFDATLERKMVRDGFAVLDNRADDEKSEVFDIDYLTHVQNPDVSGRYSVVLATGAVVDAYVIKAPYGTSKSGVTLVVDPDSGRYFTADNSCVFVRDGFSEEAKGEDKGELWNNASALGELAPGNYYTLVSQDMETSLPFKVISITSEDGELARVKVDMDHGVDYRDRHQSRDPGIDGRDYIHEYGDTSLLLTDNPGKLRRSRNNIIVPMKSWKIFKLDNDSDYDWEERKLRRENFRPGNYSDVTESMYKASLHDLKVESRDEGLAYNISLNDMVDEAGINYKTATCRLVTVYGLPVDDAEDMLKEAMLDIKSKRLVKIAQQVNIPEPFPPAIGEDPKLGIRTIPLEIENIVGTSTVPEEYQSSEAGSGINIGGDAERQALGSQSSALANQAAATGQKNVFDHAVIGGLSSIYDTSNAIDSYMPDMLKTLDRLGRLLFLFYWKNEDFAERYGDQDLMQMEDQLRAVFKNLGDLVIKLKQKTIDAGDAEYDQA